MRTLPASIGFVLFVASTAATAQYKCSINGKTTYSDAPCASNARYVGEMQDNVTSEQRSERLAITAQERKSKERIDRQEGAEQNSRERATVRTVEAERNQQAQNEYAKQRRCASLSSAMDYNQRSIARYQSFGWQVQLTQQEQELKRNREAFDRECR